jgi:hypothetical protein
LSILLKAVEVSEFGVLSCEDFESIRPLYMFKNRVQYYDGSYHYNHNFERDNKHILEDNKIDYNDKRLSHPIKQEYKDKIVELGHIMIDFLSNELDKLDKNAVNMCNFLLENPVSKVAKGVGNNIGQINDFYNQFFDSLYTKSSPQTNEVMKLITLRTITNVESTEDWFNKASELIACKEDMTVLINKIGAIRPLGFTKVKGFFVK